MRCNPFDLAGICGGSNKMRFLRFAQNDARMCDGIFTELVGHSVDDVVHADADSQVGEAEWLRSRTGKRCCGASSSLSSLSAPEWLAYCSMKDLKSHRSPRVEVFLVDRGEQLISSLHVRNKIQRVPNSARRILRPQSFYRPVTPSTEWRLHP